MINSYRMEKVTSRYEHFAKELILPEKVRTTNEKEFFNNPNNFFKPGYNFRKNFYLTVIISFFFRKVIKTFVIQA